MLQELGQVLGWHGEYDSVTSGSLQARAEGWVNKQEDIIRGNAEHRAQVGFVAGDQRMAGGQGDGTSGVTGKL